MASSSTLVDQINERSRRTSMYKLAELFGVQRERLYQIRAGSQVGPITAARILAKVREEDLALADKIEAELVASYRSLLREEAGR